MGLLLATVSILLVGGTIAFAITTYNEMNPLWHRIDEAAANIAVVLHKRKRLTDRLGEVAARYWARKARPSANL